MFNKLDYVMVTVSDKTVKVALPLAVAEPRALKFPLVARFPLE